MKVNKLNKRILILCEGLTEYFYAKALQSELPRSLQRSIAIEIIFNSNNDPRSLATEAKIRKRRAKEERNPYDAIWIFFDNDNWPKLETAFKIIESEKISIAYSSLCIEHWFILHFEDCGRSFQKGTEALNHLKTKWPAYHKTKINHYQEIKHNLEAAIQRAKVLRKTVQLDQPIHRRNPYFTIDKLIDFFRGLEQ